MIIITGAGGFIGSSLAEKFNTLGRKDLILVDDFSLSNKMNLVSVIQYRELISREYIFDWISRNHAIIDIVYHLGARTDTQEKDYSIFEKLNYNYSIQLWQECSKHSIPFVYASSAATYGNGDQGYDDSLSPDLLSPLNAYAVSKNEFDKWVLSKAHTLPFWMGFKFFNVYGPREYYKRAMASVIFHASNQLKETGKIKLFRSHREDFNDGEQLRDFIFVDDLCKVLIWAMESKPVNGIYNLGTGKARSFKDLALGVCKTLNYPPVIEFIDTPVSIRNSYQYFTEANIQKLRAAGYLADFCSLEQGIEHYFQSKAN